MKKSLLVASVLSLSGLLALGGLTFSGSMVMAKADDPISTWYYMGTNTNRCGDSWTWEEGDATLSLNAEPVVWSFQNQERFKFLEEANNWDSYGLNGYHVAGTAAGYFTHESGNDIICNYPGTYKISIEESDATTYSIVIDRLAYGETTYLYRFTQPKTGWGSDIRVYPFGSKTASNNPAWADSYYLHDYSFNENDEKVFYFLTNVSDYTTLIFRDNNDHQTADISLDGVKTAWYTTGATDGKGHYVINSWTPEDVKYYFYDYANEYDEIHCYAWAENGNGFQNAAYESAPIVSDSVANTSGQIYEISLDPMFDCFKLYNSTKEINTGDVWVNQNHSGVYTTKIIDEKNWTSLDHAKADDWIYNIMHLRDIPHDVEDGDSGNCKDSGEGYYALAKSTYAAYSNEVRAIIASYGDPYANAYARLRAWAAACNETLTISEDAGTYSMDVVSNARTAFAMDYETESSVLPFAVIIVSAGVLAAAGIGIARRHKED